MPSVRRKVVSKAKCDLPHFPKWGTPRYLGLLIPWVIGVGFLLGALGYVIRLAGIGYIMSRGGF